MQVLLLGRAGLQVGDLGTFWEQSGNLVAWSSSAVWRSVQEVVSFFGGTREVRFEVRVVR